VFLLDVTSKTGSSTRLHKHVLVIWLTDEQLLMRHIYLSAAKCFSLHYDRLIKGEAKQLVN